MNMAQAFNEWMRRYLEEPERFAREWQTIHAFQVDELVGNEPDYGKCCEAYLAKLMREKPRPKAERVPRPPAPQSVKRRSKRR